MTSTSSYCSTSDFSCSLWLGCCTPAPQSSQKPTWPGEWAVWLCQSSSPWQNKVLLRHWGCLPSFLWLEIDTLAASACTCQCEQTQELFFASHTVEWKALMKLKFYSDHNDTHSQKRIQLQFPNAKLCEVLKCSCLFIFQVFVAFDNCSRKFCARAAIYLIPCPRYYKLEALSNQKSGREAE